MRFRLRTLFAIVSVLCIVLSTGNLWSTRCYIEEDGDSWTAGISSILPITDAEVQHNGTMEPHTGEPYTLFGMNKRHEFYRARTIETCCIPKTVFIAPGYPNVDDTTEIRFTDSDWKTISIRTIFGWSHFEITRHGDSLSIRRCWSDPRTP